MLAKPFRILLLTIFLAQSFCPVGFSKSMPLSRMHLGATPESAEEISESHRIVNQLEEIIQELNHYLIEIKYIEKEVHLSKDGEEFRFTRNGGFMGLDEKAIGFYPHDATETDLNHILKKVFRRFITSRFPQKNFDIVVKPEKLRVRKVTLLKAEADHRVYRVRFDFSYIEDSVLESDTEREIKTFSSEVLIKIKSDFPDAREVSEERAMLKVPLRRTPEASRRVTRTEEWGVDVLQERKAEWVDKFTELVRSKGGFRIEGFTAKDDRSIIEETLDILLKKSKAFFQRAIEDEGHGFQHYFEVMERFFEILERDPEGIVGSFHETHRLELFLSALFHDLYVLSYEDTKQHAVDGARFFYNIFPDLENIPQLRKLGADRSSEIKANVVRVILRHDKLKAFSGLLNNLQTYKKAETYPEFMGFAHAEAVMHSLVIDADGGSDEDHLSRIFYWADKVTTLNPVRILEMEDGRIFFNPELVVEVFNSFKDLVNSPNYRVNRSAALLREYQFHYDESLDRLNIFFYNLFVKLPEYMTHGDPYIKLFLASPEFSYEALLREAFSTIDDILGYLPERYLFYDALENLLGRYLSSFKRSTRKPEFMYIKIREKGPDGFTHNYDARVITREEFEKLLEAKKQLRTKAEEVLELINLEKANITLKAA